MDVPRVGYDKKYAENYDRIFKKTPKERARTALHRFLLWIIVGRKI